MRMISEQKWLNEFGDNLKDILKEKCMTQQELADECGVVKSVISSYINKNKMPSLKTAINMAYVLDIDIDELVDFGAMIE